MKTMMNEVQPSKYAARSPCPEAIGAVIGIMSPSAKSNPVRTRVADRVSDRVSDRMWDRVADRVWDRVADTVWVA